MSIRKDGTGYMVDLFLTLEYAKWYGIPRRYRVKGFPDRRAAEQHEEEVRLAVEDKRALPAKSEEKTVPKLWECLQLTFDRHYATSSARQQRMWHIAQIKSVIPNVPIDEVTAEMVARAKTSLLRQYKPASVNVILSVLSKTLKLSLESEVITKAPKVGALKTAQKFLLTLQRDEEEKLLSSISRINPVIADLVALYLDTGCRKNELLTAHAGRVSLDRGFLTVTGKTGPRSLPLTKRALEILERYAKGRALDRRMFHVSPTTLRNHFQRGLEMAGINRPFTIHDLRHTYITRLLEKGVSPFIVQKLAGHSRITTTERYMHVGDHAMRSAIDSLEAA